MKVSRLLAKIQDEESKDLVLLKTFENSMDGMHPFVSGQIFAVSSGDEVSHLHVKLFGTAQAYGSSDIYDYSSRFNIDFGMNVDVEKLLVCQQIISLIGLNECEMLTTGEMHVVDKYDGKKLITDDLVNDGKGCFTDSHNAIHATYFAYHTLKGELLSLINKAFS